MKKIFSIFLALAAWMPIAGQNPNPQPNFSTQILSANPSLYLNFNDTTAAFRDQVSGDAFMNAFTSTVNNPGGTVGFLPTPATTNGNDAVVLTGTPLQIGPISTIAIQYHVAPTAGQTTIWIGCGAGASAITMLTNFTVNVAATTAVQTFTSGTNFSPVTITAANCYAGTWSATNTNTDFGASSGSNEWFATGQSTLPTGTVGFTVFPSGTLDMQVVTAPSTVHTTYTSGTVTPRQPGFDSTQVNNTSAEFPYNGFNVAPNNTLGSIEWNVPWTMLVHIDRLNWNRSGTLVLASKGDSSSVSNNWWQLTLSMAGNLSKLCFTRNGPGKPPTTGAPAIAQNGVCTGFFDAMPNGFNYDIVVADSGTGNSGVVGETNGGASAITIYVNGLTSPYIPMTPFTNSFSTGFGYATVIATGGTGYAASTSFTSTGGGPNCNVGGTMLAASGVMQTVNITYNYGCTSVPNIVLTSPTGTGATITVGLGGALMNSTTSPLMAPGYVSGGNFFGVAGTSSTQSPTYVDEFAIFPGVLSQTQIQSLFYQTKFWQGVVKTIPSTPYALVVDEDGCADLDNIFALQLAIAAQRIGYIRLAGVVDTYGDGLSEALYRQMLDQAGLAHIPMAVSSSFASTGLAPFCTAANMNTFNASTPQTAASYPQAKAMYRQVFASNPTTPVFIMLGGSFRGVADLMQSSADSISSLTGAQLIARNAANGGAIYAQGLGANISFTGDNSLEDWTAGQYVVQNNGAMPIYWYGGGPQITGPGILSTRTGKDPFFLLATSGGADTRQGYDSLPTQSFLSTLFSGGVTIAISGSGTGYAASTPFTSTGGGANCQVSGFMLSTGGVPSSVISTGGAPAAPGGFDGIGSGCFTAASPPTIVLTAPTGTGAVLTATTTASPCGTVTITASNAGTTTTSTCSNHYFLPYSTNAASSPVDGALMEWFINSLIDPVPGGAPRAR